MARLSPEFGQLVREILEKHGDGKKRMSFRAAERRSGMNVSHTTIRDWSMDIVPIGVDHIRYFADGLKEPRSPLLNAAGFKLTEKDIEHDRAHFPERFKDPEPPKEPQKIGVSSRRMDLSYLGEVCCGIPEVTDEDEYRDLAEHLGADAWAVTLGDSMEPYYHDGDVIFLKEVSDKGQLKPGKRYIIQTEGQGVCCREYQENANGDLIFRAVNGQYPEIRVGKDAVNVHAKVLGKFVPS